MSKLIVASLEVSTTNAKCILFSGTGGVLAETSRRYDAKVADGPFQDPNGIAAAALDVLGEIVEIAKRRELDIEAVGLTGIWHSLLLLDGERKPLGDIRTWMNLAGADHVRNIRSDAGLVDAFYHKTGCLVHASYPVWKWEHLKRQEPELTKKTQYLSSQIEFLFELFTGETLVSRTMASGTGFFNIHTLDWDEDILSVAGLNAGQLGRLVEPLHTAPMEANIARLVGLPSGIPVAVGCSDGAMNHLAIGGLDTKIMSLSVGTSGALRVAHLEPQIPRQPSTWCYYLVKGKRLAGAAVNNGTNCVDWFLNLQGHELGSGIYDEYSHGIRHVNRARAPYFMPFLFGERSPGWVEERTGGFVHMTASHKAYDCYYAILEGVLFNMRQCYDILAEVGGEPEEIVASGGIVNSDVWMQMAADILRRELVVTGSTNDSTIGGALVALEAVGGLEAILDLQVPIAKRYEPQADALEIYEFRYMHYLELYKTLK